MRFPIKHPPFYISINQQDELFSNCYIFMQIIQITYFVLLINIINTIFFFVYLEKFTN